MIGRSSLGWNSLQVKVLRFLLVGFVIIGVTLTLTAVSNNRRVTSLYEARVSEEKLILNRDLDNLTQLTKAFAPDYSQWDDPYNYLLGKLPNYAKENLTVSTLDTFNSDAVWMFKNDGTLAAKNNTTENTEGIIDFKTYQKRINELFKQNYEIHFYISTKTGFMSIYGSTVVPTEDTNHTTKSPGYVLVGKLINNSVLSGLEGSGRTKVVFKLGEVSDLATIKSQESSGVLTYGLNFNDINGKNIGTVQAEYQDGSIKVLRDSDKKLLQLNVISFLTILFALVLIIWRWVIKPINTIYTGLETVDKKMISRVENNKTEFGKIAKLINKFFDQEKALENEVEEKKQLLNKLEAYNAEIEQTNKAMIGRELRMIEIKKELATLKEKLGSKNE